MQRAVLQQLNIVVSDFARAADFYPETNDNPCCGPEGRRPGWDCLCRSPAGWVVAETGIAKNWPSWQIQAEDLRVNHDDPPGFLPLQCRAFRGRSRYRIRT